MIQIGPAGLGTPPIDNLRLFKKLGFSCAEVEFVRNIYMNAETAKKVGDEAKKLGVSLSIHCPYAINLASDDKEKIEASKKRILKSCEIGHYLKARYIVFHPAYYGKHNPEIIYNKVKDSILEMQEEINKNNWNVILCPETAGKLSQFGSLFTLCSTRRREREKCLLSAYGRRFSASRNRFSSRCIGRRRHCSILPCEPDSILKAFFFPSA